MAGIGRRQPAGDKAQLLAPLAQNNRHPRLQRRLRRGEHPPRKPQRRSVALRQGLPAGDIGAGQVLPRRQEDFLLNAVYLPAFPPKKIHPAVAVPQKHGRFPPPAQNRILR